MEGTHVAQDAETGKALAVRRFEAGITQIAVAKELGINRSTLSLIENGWRAIPEGFQTEYLHALQRLAPQRVAS